MTEFLTLDDPRPCIHCGELTLFMDFDFEAPVHAECLDGLWAEFDAANRRIDSMHSSDSDDWKWFT